MTDMVIPPGSLRAINHALNLHWWDEDEHPCACGFDFVAAGQSFKMHLADVVFALLSTEVETKALVETATRLGRELGRREALKEVADEMSEALDWRWGDDPRESYVTVQLDRDTYRQLLAARDLPTKEPK